MRSGATASWRCCRPPCEMIHGPGAGLRPADRPPRAGHRSSRAPRESPCARSATCARPRARPQEPPQGEGRRGRHPYGLRERRRAPLRQRPPLARSRLLRHRVRDHHACYGVVVGHAAERGLGNFSVFCNHCAHPVGDRGHPRLPRGQGGDASSRWLRRPGPREHDHRAPLRTNASPGTTASRSWCRGSSRSTSCSRF